MKYKIVSGSFKLGHIIELEPVEVSTNKEELQPFISLEESNKFWGNEDKSFIHYTQDVIDKCVEENKTGCDWRLVYTHGYSLRQLWEKHNDFFYSKTEPWWEDEKFADEKVRAGYYLLDFNGRFKSKDWNEQEELLKEAKMERAPLCVVIEAIIMAHKLKKDKLLEDWYHWSSALSSVGNLINFGLADAKGALVLRDRPDFADGNLRVVPVR